MFRSLPLLLAALLGTQGDPAVAESRLSAAGVGAGGQWAPVSARLAFRIDVPGVLTLQLADTDNRVLGLMDGTAGDMPVAIRVSTNQGQVMLSCSAGDRAATAGLPARIDRALVAPASGDNAQPPRVVGCEPPSYGTGTRGLSDNGPTSQPALVRLYTASQP